MGHAACLRVRLGSLRETRRRGEGERAQKGTRRADVVAVGRVEGGDGGGFRGGEREGAREGAGEYGGWGGVCVQRRVSERPTCTYAHPGGVDGGGDFVCFRHRLLKKKQTLSLLKKKNEVRTETSFWCPRAPTHPRAPARPHVPPCAPTRPHAPPRAPARPRASARVRTRPHASPRVSRSPRTTNQPQVAPP